MSYVDSLNLGKGVTFPQRALYTYVNGMTIRNITCKIYYYFYMKIVDEKIDSQLIIKCSATPIYAIQEYSNFVFEKNKIYANIAINSDRDSKIVIRNSTF